MLGQWIGNKQIADAVSNLKHIMTKTNVKTVVYDHHLARDIKYRERMAGAYKSAEQHGVKLITAAEFRSKQNLFLEAWRKVITKGEMQVPESRVKEYY
jgi:predicted metallo-beta-lactamase superfamily hydrolase